MFLFCMPISNGIYVVCTYLYSFPQNSAGSVQKAKSPPKTTSTESDGWDLDEWKEEEDTTPAGEVEKYGDNGKTLQKTKSFYLQ